MSAPSPAWLASFASALAAEFAARPPVAALATADPHGHPRVRHVVLRDITPDGHLLITSDARSEKNHHLRANPFAEAAFWLPSLRVQFRLRGEVRILDPRTDCRGILHLWRGLTDPSRALFFWPTPGSPRDPGTELPAAIAAETPPPPHFEVLALIPAEVDHLDLNPTPHRRIRYGRDRGWQVEEINP